MRIINLTDIDEMWNDFQLVFMFSNMAAILYIKLKLFLKVVYLNLINCC